MRLDVRDPRPGAGRAPRAYSRRCGIVHESVTASRLTRAEGEYGPFCPGVQREETAMTKWTIEGTQINKDGADVFLSGVCYSPTPAGAATYEPGVGDWFTPPWD